MRRTHRLSARLIRWTSLGVCFALILASLTLVTPISRGSGFMPQGRNGQSGNDKAKKVKPSPPQPGAPAAQLPSLDEVRQRQHQAPNAARHIESTMRSRRKPMESRHGRKVGDPLPLPKTSAKITGDGGERASITSADARGYVGTARLNHARTARSLPAGGGSSSASPASLLKLIDPMQGLSNHSAFDFLHYPTVHSDTHASSISAVHTVGSKKNGASSFVDDVNTARFDFFVPMMPQSGSSKIAFASNRTGSTQIYVMSGDGNGQTRLTYSGANDDYPRWSPNGAKILFQSDRDNSATGYMDIYVMNADGSGVTRLTSDANDDSMATWSPDGTKIVFQSLRNGVSYQVYSMNADGSNQVSLTNTLFSEGEPSWSPDGTKIAFASDRDRPGFDSVYVMNGNGSNQTRITFSTGDLEDTQPVWARDGSKIAFVSTRDSILETWQETDDNGNVITKSKRDFNKEIYVMNADGSGQTRLTTNLANDDSPSWSPDGSKIVFRSDRERDCCDPSAQVWTMNADGSAQINVSNSSNGDYSASWANGSFNQIPIANAGGSYSGTVGQNISFNGGGSSDPDGSIVSYAWNFGDSGTGSGVAPTHVYTTAGTYNVTLTVTDNNGATASATASATVIAANQPPVANAGGPYSGVTGSSIQFNGSASHDSDGSIVSYAWNFGDGGTGSGVAPAHVYTTAGTYNVTLTVTDNNGATASATATATVTVPNQPPVANAGGAYSGLTAQTIDFNGGGSSDSDGSIVSYLWTFGDGGTGSGAAPLHSYTAVGTYTVSLTVTDNRGAQASVTTTATITTSTADFYTQNFIQVALARQPNTNEVNYWEDILRAAHTHQQGSMTIAVREMARTMFESAEYAARGRDNHQYVYDLYETYLMRYPDADGWAFWEGQCNAYGREQVRRAFDECGEFAGDVAAITPNGSATTAVSSLLSARIDPNNQTGNQLLARDADWSMPLLSLPGRAGLDLGLGLSYSSASVWTRSGPYSYFDEDNGTPSPGFRLGFPTVQEVFFDAQVGVNARVLITPSGHRVELRQIGSSNVYEAADSSYLQLIDYGSSLLVRSTDGTQMSYVQLQDDWHCTQTEDRNGNLISVNYDWRGDIANLTDTLGRVITFNYDGNANLISITQTWSGQTHTWATFGWGNIPMQPDLQGVVGTHNGDVIPMLTQVGLDDGSLYTFEYNANGLVNMIRRYTAPDYVQRSYMGYDYAPSADGSPRVTGQRVWAENWTGVNGLPNEVLTQFTDPGDGSHVMTAPDGTIYKEFYGGGWQRGLPVQSQVLSNGLQKTTTTAWTQDNTNVNYQTNPRVTETNIYDSANNRSRTTIGYYTFSLPTGVSCSLPTDSYEYQADAVNVARHTHTDYTVDANYLNRRIIGLPQATFVYDGASSLMAKNTYVYDWGAEYLQGLPATPTQHDGNYSTDFVVGRGNLVDALQWDVNDPNNATRALESKTGYDINGSALFTSDALNHLSSLHYGDWFSDGADHNTFAYATTVTDPDGNNSSAQYNYDFGAKTRVQGPPPNNQPNGIVQTFTYDNAARIQQVTTLNTGAYSRYVYGPNYTQTFASVNNIADDAYSIKVFDGAGRVFAAATNHPGSTGGYSAVLSIYDAMGRIFMQSNPTEISGGWAPTGDDAVGWIFTQQTYDWKGRRLLTSHLTDGTTKQASYSACGCAGSEVATFTDEMGRQQNVYHDRLGRVAKTEVMNGNSVYSTTANSYNGRDQVTLVRQYQGNDQSGVYQDTTMSYDGYGRLQSEHVPEQNAGTSTVYAYNADGTVYSITDARGASATYGYNNNRHLVSGVTYSAPSGVTPTSNVSFAYDATGNRVSMNDGFGSKSYSYNQLSQLMSETRTFNGIGTFTLSYDYNLAGELVKITDPTNMTINYGFDNAGRLNGVTGSDNLYAGVSNYASTFQYRAWGGLKATTDGRGYVSSLLYNAKLQPSHFQISGNTVTQDYDYYNDGRISVVHNTTDQTFDRSYSYDHVGRLTEAKSGANVNGYQYGAIPYHETFGYDGFSNLTARQSQSWNGLTDDSDSAAYTNNRRAGWGYDADGRNTTIDTRTNTFDAAGRQTLMVAQQVLWNGNHITVNQASGYDGDGARIQDVSSSVTTYYLRSSVLGGAIIEELNNSGQKNAGYVCLPGGVLLATQTPGVVTWKHNTPAGTTEYTANSYNNATGRTEFDPLGANLSLSAPPDPPPSEGAGDVGVGHFGGIMDQRWSDFFNLESGFTVNGFSISSSEAMFYLNFGTGNKGLNSVSASGVATALGVKFAHAGASKVAFGNPGVEGTPGHQTLEWGWTKLGETGPLVYTLVSTTYSGTSAIPGSIVTLASSIQASPTQASAFRAREQNAVGEAYRLLESSDCVDFMRALVRQAAKVTGQLNSITLSLGGGSSMTAYNFNSFTGLQAYQAAIDNGWVRSLTERPGYTMTEGAEGETLRHTQKGSFGDIIGEISMHEVTWRNSFYGATLTEAGQKTLHESLHQLPGFTDQLLANAARYAAGQAQEAYGDSDSEKLRASRDLTDRINQHCR
jgi:YD repeat-containing protein